MITKHDLQEAIAECQGIRNPNADTCIKLASFLTIQKEMFGEKQQEEPHSYSFASMPIEQVETVIDYESDTEFSKAINGRMSVEIWEIVDEAMSAIQVLNPQLYKSIMRKIEY